MSHIHYLEVGNRPWGNYYVMEDEPNFKVKKLEVYSNSRLSLQNHQHRSEHWTVVQGVATVEIEDLETGEIKKTHLRPNQSCFIPVTAKHRLSNEHEEPVFVIEVQCGDYTGEDDIQRFEDDYKRV